MEKKNIVLESVASNANDANVNDVNVNDTNSDTVFQRMARTCYKMSFEKLCHTVALQNELFYAALTVSMDRAVNDFTNSRSLDKANAVITALAHSREKSTFIREFTSRANACDICPGRDGVSVELVQAGTAAVAAKADKVEFSPQYRDMGKADKDRFFKAVTAVQARLEKTRFGTLRKHNENVEYEERLKKQLQTMISQYEKACKGSSCRESTKTMMEAILASIREARFL